jgi:hypothetical protein
MLFLFIINNEIIHRFWDSVPKQFQNFLLINWKLIADLKKACFRFKTSASEGYMEEKYKSFSRRRLGKYITFGGKNAL